MKMKKYGSFDEYFADQSPKNRSIIRTLRTFVKRVAPGLQESVKWGNGCWVMGSVPGRLRLLGSGLRPVWLLPRLWLEGSAADS
jgi:hypothetical protein